MTTVTAVTVTIPERRDLFHQLRQSIATQTRRPTEWLVATDHNHEGPAPHINRLVEQAASEWVFRCDDDDLFDPNHFATIWPNLTDDADIVYTWPRVEPAGRWIQPKGLQILPADIDFLYEQNFIASAAAVRRSLWLEIGGYRDVFNEDHDLWVRALDAGARFCCIPQVTWTYRLGDWPHLSRPEENP